jgi:hypothetical protein
MSFEVTEAAADLQLLTIEEMRSAAGVPDTTQDAALTAMGLRVAECIADECNVRQEDSGENPPTLLRERITETLDVDSASTLVLARRHALSVQSINDATDLDGVVVDGGAGTLRLRSGRWTGMVVVDYYAGFAAPPAALKQAALDCFRLFWLEQSRDPSLKGQEIDVPGTYRERNDYWVGSLPGQAKESPVPDVVAGQLKRFRTPTVA